MKTWKRIASIVLMIMMLVTMILPVWGGGIPSNPAKQGTITVKDHSTSTKKVEVYTIFAYKDDEGDIQQIGIEKSDKWWDAILAYMGYGTEEKRDSYVGKGINILALSGYTTYDVDINDSIFDKADFIAYLKTKMSEIEADETLTLVNGEATYKTEEGYYFVVVEDEIGYLCILDHEKQLNVTLSLSGTNDNQGKITIDNAVVDQTYTIYQILTLESYDKVQGAYAYKATSKWKDFVESDGIKDVYLKIDAQDYVTWKMTCTQEEHTHTSACNSDPANPCSIEEHTHSDVGGKCYADAAAFAKLAKKWADDQSIEKENSKTATAENTSYTTIEFTDLNLGYYLVDTSIGTLCSLDTTDKEVTIKEKNDTPTALKYVEEDSKSVVIGGDNDADIGQSVTFLTRINANMGAENYVLHDKMEAGLTFDNNIVISGDDVAGALIKGKEYTVETENLTDGCTFEVHFNQEYLNTITERRELWVVYSATLNKDAVVGFPGNKNTTYLTYGVNSKTKESTTITYTWDFDVLKYANGVETDTLADAEFILYKKVTVSTTVNGTTQDEPTETTEYAKFDNVKDKDNNKTNKWKFIGWVNSENEATTLTTLADGKLILEGLDSNVNLVKFVEETKTTVTTTDAYYLKETKAPNGYNVLAEDKIVKLEPKIVNNVIKEYKKPTVKINNQSGTELPSTGGVGTTIFYCAGAVLALGAFVLLITRKRMQKQ